MLNKYSEHISGGFMILVGAVVLFASQGIKRMAGVPIGSDFFPRIAAVMLLAFGAITVVGAFRTRRKNEAGDSRKAGCAAPAGADEVRVEINWKAPLLSVVALTAYVALLDGLGFLIMTTLYLFAQITILAPAGKRNYPLFGGIAVATTALVYGLFVRVLYVMLPAGILG